MPTKAGRLKQGPGEALQMEQRGSADIKIIQSFEQLRRTKDGSVSDRQKKELIEAWLSECAWGRDRMQEPMSQEQREQPNNMPHTNHYFTSVASKSSRLTASVHDPEYRRLLDFHNIHIHGKDPPAALMDRAREIVHCPRGTPGLDYDHIAAFRKTVRNIEAKGEEHVKAELGPTLIPGLWGPLSDDKLERSHSQLWTKTVPVPLNADFPREPTSLSLPKPKPDTAFGYSERAFNPSQRLILDLLTDDSRPDSSFARPDPELYFPYLVVEFKSVKDGSHFTAFNQAAGAGAVAMNGIVELFSRCENLEIDRNKPHFFSLTIDQNMGCINVHWIGKETEPNQYSFHLENLSKHSITEAKGIKAISCAVKNIRDYAVNQQLKSLTDALDECAKELAVQKKKDEQNKDEKEKQEEKKKESRTLPTQSKQRQKGARKGRKAGAMGKRKVNKHEQPHRMTTRAAGVRTRQQVRDAKKLS